MSYGDIHTILDKESRSRAKRSREHNLFREFEILLATWLSVTLEKSVKRWEKNNQDSYIVENGI